MPGQLSLLCVLVCCNVLQRAAPCYSVLDDKICSVLFRHVPGQLPLFCVAVCCSVLQCVAVCCNVLQCVALPNFAVCFSARTWAASSFLPAGVKKNESTDIIATTVKASVAVCCSVLQCVAVCCSVLQCVAVCCSVMQCVAVCRVLQRVAECCSVLPSVAVPKTSQLAP